MGLIIACVLRSGGVYGPDWVGKLARQCARWAPPHRFICLSDIEVPCERIPLEHDWPSWWAKIELFKWPGPMITFDPECRTFRFQIDGLLYFDLDTLIVGDLSDIARRTVAGSGFTILRDFYRHAGYGSGVMAWDVGQNMAKWHQRFAADPYAWMDRLTSRGDQGFIEEMPEHGTTACWQDLLPGQIVSYKANRCREHAPDGARVVCYHGQPKPNNCGGWAQELWDAA